MASTRLLRAQLFGVEALDPATIVSAAAVVTACAALAALGPSLRASGIDPVVALRED
jgi:ABC-type antimicrobial peptide transport system permease subunit